MMQLDRKSYVLSEAKRGTDSSFVVEANIKAL